MNRKTYLAVVFVLTILFGILAFAHIWFNSQLRIIRMRYREIEEQKLIVSNDTDQLRCEIEYLTSPERLRGLAEKLDMSLPETEPNIIVK